MRFVTDMHIMPRLLNGDPCPKRGRPLRVTTMDRARRFVGVAADIVPLLPVWGGDASSLDASRNAR